jgi:hypothetical protein
MGTSPDCPAFHCLANVATRPIASLSASVLRNWQSGPQFLAQGGIFFAQIVQFGGADRVGAYLLRKRGVCSAASP